MAVTAAGQRVGHVGGDRRRSLAGGWRNGADGGGGGAGRFDVGSRRRLFSSGPAPGGDHRLGQGRVRRWLGWFVGVPKSVELRYHPGAVISDKLWPGDALAALADVLGGGYRVRRYDPRRGILKLWAKPQVVRADTDPTVDRAVSMMHQLFGQSATVKASVADSGLQLVSVSHECGVKATFPVWRERVERVVTTMLQGRWRARWDLQHDAVTFELRPEIEAFVQRPAPVEDPASPDFYKIPLGVDEDNQIVSWDLNSSMPALPLLGEDR